MKCPICLRGSLLYYGLVHFEPPNDPSLPPMWGQDFHTYVCNECRHRFIDKNGKLMAAGVLPIDEKLPSTSSRWVILFGVIAILIVVLLREGMDANTYVVVRVAAVVGLIIGGLIFASEWNLRHRRQDGNARQISVEHPDQLELHYDGLYLCADNSNGSLSCLRFYADGLVLDVSTKITGSFDELLKWFNRNSLRRFYQIIPDPYIGTGHYKIHGNEIAFSIRSIEGTVDYQGAIYSPDRLSLNTYSHINGHRDDGRKYDFHTIK